VTLEGFTVVTSTASRGKLFHRFTIRAEKKYMVEHEKVYRLTHKGTDWVYKL